MPEQPQHEEMESIRVGTETEKEENAENGKKNRENHGIGREEMSAGNTSSGVAEGSDGDENSLNPEGEVSSTARVKKGKKSRKYKKD
eukprot:TRINITY_DN2387_c0_g1_i10.p2 TRINITY_DN2387_c0_g1~~TRINITY_DN2387_c0_g1_i10.p2  ORF type:complete len:102 (+),score=24.16 TRINITY_DN2387_c0_g1_i10:47-307(+)